MTENTETQAQPEAAANPNTPQQQVAIQKVYTKDISFEAPNVPDMFVHPPQVAPEVNFQMATAHTPVQDELHEVVLKLTVTVTMGDKTAFLVELQQAGLFIMRGFQEQQMPYLINSYCPNILFPFAREAISDLVVRGGFPQLLLEPINFDAAFAQRVQRAQQEAEAAQPSEEPQAPAAPTA